jgi:MFS family permease
MPRAITTGCIALALTAPGQTAAVSVFVNPLIQSLHLSRPTVSAAYLIGSLSGAFVMPFIGRLIDRFGPRRVMIVIAVAFGAILLAASTVHEIVGLTAAFIGIRVGGQGALNLVATTTVAVYVHRRRGFAMGLTSAVGSAGISLAPLLLEPLIADLGWSRVWALEGLAVWLVVIPAALLLLPRTPPPRPNPVDEPATTRHTAELPTVDWTLRQALRTGMFWVVTGGVGTASLISTGLNFQQQSLLGERGLSATEAAATFLPQTIAGLAATFALGWLADRLAERTLIISTMAVLAAATAGAGWLHPGWSAILYGIALGACGNGVRTLEAVAFPRSFGLRHIGAIRGVVHSITVGASAFGPLALAIGRAHATSYRPVLLVLLVLPITVILAGTVVRTPPPRPPTRHSPARSDVAAQTPAGPSSAREGDFDRVIVPPADPAGPA